MRHDREGPALQHTWGQHAVNGSQSIKLTSINNAEDSVYVVHVIALVLVGTAHPTQLWMSISPKPLHSGAEM